LSHTPVHFALVILKMESVELFAQAGLEPLSSHHSVPQTARIVTGPTVATVF
jgi:hypothetical protein